MPATDQPPSAILQETSGRAGEIPYVENREPVGAIKVAWPAIEFQPALPEGYRRPITYRRLDGAAADALAGAVDVPRPGIGRRHLKPARKAAIHAPLHGVVGRIPLAGANISATEVRMKTLARLGPAG